MWPCLPLRRILGGSKKKNRPRTQQPYKIEIHSEPHPDRRISNIIRVSVLDGPGTADLVSQNVVEESQNEIYPYTGTVLVQGTEWYIKGYVDLTWSFERTSNVEETSSMHNTRFYVPVNPDPPFDAVFSKETAHRYGIA